MNEIERQILKNQKTIMSFLNFGFKEQLTDGILSDSLSKRFDETNELLSPKGAEEEFEKKIKKLKEVLLNADFSLDNDFNIVLTKIDELAGDDLTK